MDCGVCLEEFNSSGTNTPVMLVPCGHTICLKCNSKLYACPYCRRIIIQHVKNFNVLEVVTDKKNGNLVHLKTSVTKTHAVNLQAAKKVNPRFYNHPIILNTLHFLTFKIFMKPKGVFKRVCSTKKTNCEAIELKKEIDITTIFIN